MIADCALRFPEREAIVCEERRINFGQLNNTANILANAFLERGQKVGEIFINLEEF